MQRNTAQIRSVEHRYLHGALPPALWGELHDSITLALEALGERPEDFTPDFLANCLMHLRVAMKITNLSTREIAKGGWA